MLTQPANPSAAVHVASPGPRVQRLCLSVFPLSHGPLCALLQDAVQLAAPGPLLVLLLL